MLLIVFEVINNCCKQTFFEPIFNGIYFKLLITLCDEGNKFFIKNEMLFAISLL